MTTETKYEIGDRVEAGEGDDRDTGTVRGFDGRLVLVGWDQGVTTPTPVEDIRKLAR